MPVSQFRRIDAVLAPNSGARPLPSYDGRSHTTNEDERGRHECARATLNHAHRGRATGSHGIFPWAADAEHRGGQHSHSRTCAKAGVSNPAHSAVANFRADGRRRSRAVHRGLLLRMDAADRRADARASGCVGSADGGDWRTGDAGSELGRESWGRAASCNWRRRSSCDWESAAPDSARLSNWERSFSAANTARITARGDSAEAAATLRRLQPLNMALTSRICALAFHRRMLLVPACIGRAHPVPRIEVLNHQFLARKGRAHEQRTISTRAASAPDRSQPHEPAGGLRLDPGRTREVHRHRRNRGSSPLPHPPVWLAATGCDDDATGRTSACAARRDARLDLASRASVTAAFSVPGGAGMRNDTRSASETASARRREASAASIEKSGSPMRWAATWSRPLPKFNPSTSSTTTSDIDTERSKHWGGPPVLRTLSMGIHPFDCPLACARYALAGLLTGARVCWHRKCVSKHPTHDWLGDQRTKPLADKHSDQQPNDRSITSSLLHESLKKERGGNKTRCRDLSQANLAHGAIQLRNVAEDAFGLRHERPRLRDWRTVTALHRLRAVQRVGTCALARPTPDLRCAREVPLATCPPLDRRCLQPRRQQRSYPRGVQWPLTST